MVTKVTFVGESFTRKPPKFEKLIRPRALRFNKTHVAPLGILYSCNESESTNLVSIYEQEMIESDTLTSVRRSTVLSALFTIDLHLYMG